MLQMSTTVSWDKKLPFVRKGNVLNVNRFEIIPQFVKENAQSNTKIR